jgi:hypothetical protein
MALFDAINEVHRPWLIAVITCQSGRLALWLCVLCPRLFGTRPAVDRKRTTPKWTIKELGRQTAENGIKTAALVCH